MNIIKSLPKQRQTLLFSATLKPNIKLLAELALKSPQIISIHKDSKTSSNLIQVYTFCTLDKKIQSLISFLRAHPDKKL